MKQKSKNKLFFWLFKILGIVISCALPIWAICEKFPLWKESHGTGQSLGFGFFMILFVATVIFHKTVFNFITEKLGLKHAPPIVIWLVLLICSYALLLLANFLHDLNVILWMGLLGCAIGNVLTFVATRFDEEDQEDAEENK